MVAKRKNRALSKVVLDFIDEMTNLDYSEDYADGFKKEIEFEEKFAVAPERSKPPSTVPQLLAGFCQ